MPQTEQHCWAAPIGGCGGGVSREHMISASQFDANAITIQGLPWCPAPKTVGLASLVAKNLCVRHNSALSPVDAEAARFKHALQNFLAVNGIEGCTELDGRLIERWLLKTTINLALQGDNACLNVTKRLVRAAYGLEPPAAGRGFFFVGEAGEQVTFGGGIRFESWMQKSDQRMVMAVFVFHGCRAVYAFNGAPPVQGALRVREMIRGNRSIRVRWHPPLKRTDRTMPPRKSRGPVNRQ